MNHAPKSSPITYLAVIGTISLWALAYVAIRSAIEHFDPEALGFLRYLCASVAILPLYWLLVPQKRIPNGKQAVLLFITGSIGIGAYNILVNLGEVIVQASITGFVISLVPVVVALMAVVFLKERIHIVGWIGVLVALIGLIVIYIAQSNHHFEVNYGVIHLCMAVFCSAFYVMMQKPLLKHFKPLEIAAWCIWFATIAMAIWGPVAIAEVHTAPTSAILAVIFLGIGPGACAYALWSFALSHLKVSRAASMLYLVPFLTLLFSWLLLSEVPTWLGIVGGITALLGALMIVRAPKPN